MPTSKPEHLQSADILQRHQDRVMRDSSKDCVEKTRQLHAKQRLKWTHLTSHTKSTQNGKYNSRVGDKGAQLLVGSGVGGPSV